MNNDYGGLLRGRWNAAAHRCRLPNSPPHKFVTNWDTPILIVTGEKDYRIPYTQSLEASRQPGYMRDTEPVWSPSRTNRTSAPNPEFWRYRNREGSSANQDTYLKGE